MPLDFSQLRSPIGGNFGDQKPRRNALTAGVSSGIDDLQGLGYNALGAVADVTGADRLKNWALEQAARNEFESQANGRPDLEGVENQTLESALPFAAYQIAKQVPQIAGAIGLGMVAPEVAIPAGLTRAATLMPRAIGGGGLKAGADFATRRAALQAGQKWAENAVGGAALGTVMGAGSMYGESVDAGNPNAAAALALSPLYGVTEGIPQAVLGGTLAKGTFNGRLPARMLKAGATDAAAGATSELIQNEMEMGFNPTLSADERFSRRLNAGVIGGMAEGAFGSLGGLRRPPTPVNLLPGANTSADSGETWNGSTALVPQGKRSPATIEPPLVEPDVMTRYGAPNTPLLPGPAATGDDPLVVTPGGTVARMSQLSGLQADMFGGPDVLPEGTTSLTPQSTWGAASSADLNRQAMDGAEPTTETGPLFQAHPDALVRTEFGTQQITAALRQANGGKFNAQLSRFIPEFSRAIEQGPHAVEALIAKYDNSRSTLKSDVFEVAAQMALDFQSRITNAQAQGGMFRNPNQNNWLTSELGTYTNDTTDRQIRNGYWDNGVFRDANDDSADIARSNNQRMQLAEQRAEQGDLLAGQIADTDARVAGGREQRSAQERRAVLDSVMETASSAGNARNRFIKALRKQGFNNLMVSAEEQKAIDSFFNAKQAFPDEGDVIPSAPDEMGNLVKEKKAAPAAKAGKPERTNENKAFRLTPPAATEEDLAAQKKAQEKRERKAGVTKETPAEEGKAADKGQGKLFTAKGQPTVAATKANVEVKTEPVKITPEIMADLEASAAADNKAKQARKRADRADNTLATDDPARQRAAEKANKAEAEAAAARDKANSHFLPKQETKAEPDVPKKAEKTNTSKKRVQETPKNEQVNADLTNDTQSLDDAVKEAKARFDKMMSKDVTPDIRDQGAILALIDAGDLDGANAMMADIATGIRENRYRTKQAQSAPTSTISHDDLQKIVDDVNKALGGDTNVTILDSVTQFDPKQQAGSRSGVTTEGRVILFRDGISSGIDGLKTVFHELFHKGLRNLLSKEQYTSLMNRMYDQSSEIRKLADQYLNSETGKADTAKMSQADARALAVEEVLAEKAEAKAFGPSTLRKLGNWFADVADALGLKKLAQWLRSAGVSPLQQFIDDALKASVGGDAEWGKAKFNRWFGNSKVVDENGKPLVVYHGTNADISTFWDKFAGSNTPNSGMYGKAPGYFTNSTDNANGYAVGNPNRTQYAPGQVAPNFVDTPSGKVKEGANVMPVYISIQNPLEVKSRSELDKFIRGIAGSGKMGARSVTAALKAMGYDGVIVDGGAEIVPFNQTQIKSATGNNGDFDPTDPDIRFRPGTDAFAKWFGNSKVVNENNEPVRLYTGTSKDKDFTKFNVPRNGVWLTSDPSEASMYSTSNDSQGMKYDHDKRGYVEVNTASRVMPVYARIENPAKLSAEDSEKMRKATNYKKVQGEIFDRLRAQGHDGVDLGGGTWVVLKDANQIKSAIGNNGQYSTTSPDIRFRTPKEAVKKMASVFSDDNLGKARRFVLSSTFLRDIKARFGKDLDGVDQFVDSTFDMSASAATYQEAAIKVREAFDKLNEKDQQAVSDLMADATYNRVTIEPTAKRGNDHLKDDDGNLPSFVKELQDRFNALTADQKAVYRKARDELLNNWNKRGDLLARTANEIYDPLIAEAERVGDKKKAEKYKRERRAFLADTNARLNQMQGDYFPMMRFGEWVVTKKSAAYEAQQDRVEAANKALEDLTDKYDTPTTEQAAEIKAARDEYNKQSDKLEAMKANEADYYMTQFESQGEANWHAKEIGGKVALKRETLRELNPINRTMLGRLEDSIAASMRAGGNTQAMRDAKRAMYEVFLTTLPERSALMREAKRKNVAGFSKDMQRSIISSMLRDSFYLSRMEHSEAISEAVNTAYTDAQDQGDTRLQEVHNELARRYAASLRYVETPVQDMMTGAAYAFKLGISPGYLIANMMQPWMVSLPMLRSRHGWGQSVKAFGQAYADTAELVKKSIAASMNGDIDFSSLAADEQRMLTAMLKQRLLNVTLVADLARTADGKKTSKWTSWLAKPSHFVEAANRVSTALAAYRMEKAKSGEAAATEYAQRVLADTHFDYSTENAPYWMKPGTLPGNKVVFQFQKYRLGMISMMVKAASAWAKQDGVSSTEARKQLTGLMMTHFAVGGALGIPAANAALWAITQAVRGFGDDKEPWDAEVALRNWLYENFGKDIGDVAAKGLPTMAGIDLSQKVGLGDIVTPLPTLRSDKTGRDFALELLATAAGPSVGLGINMFEAASFMAHGDFVKGAEKAMPKWIADPIKAGRFAEEGITTKQGTVAVKGEDITAWRAFLQATGVPSSFINDTYEARAAQQNAMTEMKGDVTQVKKDWLEAKLAGDNAKAEGIWQDIQKDINPVRKRYGLEPITMSTLYQYRANRHTEEGKYEKFGAATNAKMAELGKFARP